MEWQKMAELSSQRPYYLNFKTPTTPSTCRPSTRLPTLFLSHGSPMSSVQDTPASQFWKLLGAEVMRLPGLKSVLVVSAHWETPHALRVNTTSKPPTIHDFYGFPPDLYRLHYPVSGSPTLATRVLQLLSGAGIPAEGDAEHGLDHGAWVPLRWMFPNCPVPVVQLSLLAHAPGAHHLRVGQALAPLRDEGVLILGSGSSVHNLRDLRLYMGNGKIPPYTEPFEDALASTVEAEEDPRSRSQQLTALESNPLFKQAHPTPEHFYPLNVAVGAGGEEQGRKLFGMSEMSIGYTALSFGTGI